jgi:hypothetical protein
VTQRPPDKRLYTVRNLVAAEGREPAEQPEVFEFEVYCEAPAHGEFRGGPFSLVPWDAEPSPPGVRRSLLLTIANHLSGDESRVRAPTKAGFYHGVSMPAEFCALATVILRRRLGLGPVVRAHDVPIRLSAGTRVRHNPLAMGEIKLAELKAGVDALTQLREDYHQTFVLACRMYQEALAVIDDKPDIAYLLLVTAVEVFVAKMGRRTAEADLIPELRDALAKVSDEQARKLLLGRILDLDRGIARNFVSCIVDLVGDEFWDQSPKISTEKGRVDRGELPELLRRIYGQRSKTLHEAEPFPPNIVDPPDGDAEIDRSEEVIVGERRWTHNQIIPYVRFFERLVQHVLVRFLLCNGMPPPAPATDGVSGPQ